MKNLVQRIFHGGLLLVLLCSCSGSSSNAELTHLLGDTLNILLESEGGALLTEGDIIQGLKQALEIGAQNTVAQVSQTNGYYNNTKIRIPLPESVRKYERTLRAVGFGNQVDAFERSMNRAAEQAAPEAKSLFVDAIRQITFSDARKILGGNDNEATLYFKDKTYGRLQGIFKPIARKSMARVGVTNLYQRLDSKIKAIPFSENLRFDLDQYVTNLALEGLFSMLAEEEAKIRRDPAARVTELLRRVFGNQG